MRNDQLSQRKRPSVVEKFSIPENVEIIFPDLNDEIKTEYSLFKFGNKPVLEKFSKLLSVHLEKFSKDEFLILAPSLKHSSAIRFLLEELDDFNIVKMLGSSANVIATPYSSLNYEDRKEQRNKIQYSISGECPDLGKIKKVFLLDDCIVSGQTLDILKKTFEAFIDENHSFDYEKLCLISIDPQNASLEHSINRFFIDNNPKQFQNLYENSPESFNYTNYLIRFLKTNEGSELIKSKTTEFQEKVMTVLKQFQ